MDAGSCMNGKAFGKVQRTLAHVCNHPIGSTRAVVNTLAVDGETDGESDAEIDGDLAAHFICCSFRCVH